MKTLLFAFLGIILCLQAQSSTLTTSDGATYNNVTTQRADPDGLYIEYTLPGGGVGMSKVKYSRLPADQQKQFGYDAAKAHDYETQVAKANEDFRQESLRDEQIAQAARRAREQRDDKALNEQLLAQAQSDAAQLNQPATSVPGYNYGSGYWGGGVGVPGVRHYIPARRVYAPIVTPIPFPQINTPRHTSSSTRVNSIGHL
jgi:hypothetical protein